MKHPKFKYRGFGLNISSEIEFPELYNHDFESEDVSIDEGPISESWFEHLEQDRVAESIEPDLYMCQIPDAGRYMVTGGERIQIASWANADQTAFRMYTLTAAFSACLVQRNQMLLHASAVIINGSAFLLAGASGAGKSTLLSLLMQKGYRIFSDDVCVFNGQKNETGRWLVSSSYPVIKLDKAGMDRFFQIRQKLRLWPDSEKFGVYFHEHYEPGAIPVSGIAILTKDESIREINIEKLEGIKAFEKLAGCTFRSRLMKSIDQQRRHADVISGLVQTTPVYHLRRTDKQDNGEDLLKELEVLMSRVQNVYSDFK